MSVDVLFRSEEVGLAEERRLLESDKASHQKELKRLRNEDDSIYMRDLKCLGGVPTNSSSVAGSGSSAVTLPGRYQLLSLLGKGGFSEVWRAMDLFELREVAVKVSVTAVCNDNRLPERIRPACRYIN
jgi:tousled-like kinase